MLLLAWRHLAFRPGKTLASVLGIAVGLATVVTVLVVDHNTLLTQDEQRTQGDPDADLIIEPDRSSPLGLDEIAESLGAESTLVGVTAWGRTSLSLQVDGKAKSGIDLFAVEAAARDHHQAWAVEEGEDLDFESDVPQLLVSPDVAERAGLAVGDLIELAEPAPRRKGPVVLCLDGQWTVERTAGGGGDGGRAPVASVHPFRVVGILAPTRLGFGMGRAITTLSVASDRFGRKLNTLFWADIDRTRTDLVQVTQLLGDSYVVTAPRRSLVGLAPEERAFRSGVRFCGFLALFLGLYIIFNTMSMSLVERVRSIGLLRAMGLSRGRLAGIFLLEGLALAALGAGASLWLAKQLVSILESAGITTLGRGKPLEITEIPWNEISAVLITGVVFCLLGVLYPFVRASRLSVIDALRRGVIELARDPFTGVRRSVLIGLLAVVPVAWIVGAPTGEWMAPALYEAVLMAFGLLGSAFALLLLVPGLLRGLGNLFTAPFKGPAASLARATLATARHRVFGTVSGLMLVFTAIFLIISVLESLKAETRNFGDRALTGNVYLKLGPQAAQRLPELRRLAPELARLLPLTAEVGGGFTVRGIDGSLLDDGPLRNNAAVRGAFLSRPSILLSTRCADDLGKGVGDTVRLATYADGIVDFEVLAVTDAYGFSPDDRVFGAVSAEIMASAWCEDGEALPGWFMSRSPGTGTGRADELATLVAGLVGEEELVALVRGEDVTEGYVADLERNFAIFHAILALTVLLAAVGILNAMVIAVMERRREIGLLRAVGMTGGQLAAMLFAESGVLGALGGLFGLVLGIPLAAATCKALTEMSHLDLAFSLEPRALGAVLGGAIAISILAILLPALRAKHLSLSRVVRYE
jgi:putative ABC transport system permease protein